MDDNAESLAGWAALLADRTRASFCLALLDGRAWTVGELARHAGVAVSTASEHADRLVAGGLLIQRKQGRHRYLQLASAETATLIETVAAAGPPVPPAPVVSLSAAHRRKNLAHARTCYDHLAGYIGVSIADALFGDGLISRTNGLALTPRGNAWLTSLGISLDKSGKRPVVRECLDWTERRSHLAGQVGAALCRHAFDAGWIVRIGSGRAVNVTAHGARALEDQLGIVTGAAAKDVVTGAAKDVVTGAARDVVTGAAARDILIGAAAKDSPGAAHAAPAGGRRP